MSRLNAKNMTLATLVKPLLSVAERSMLHEQLAAVAEREIGSMTLDSRAVDPLSVFIAVKGHAVDARSFIGDVVEAGCGLILAEADELTLGSQWRAMSQHLYCHQDEAGNTSVLVAVEQLNQRVSEIAARFYHKPTQRMSVVGITGTNGKTSVCALTAQALQFLNHSPLMLGTLGNGVIGEKHGLNDLVESSNTTPSPVDIQRLAREALEHEHYYMAMEVSSHAMSQKRCDAVEFDVAVFTNLSQDHLDYHGDMESYFQAKRELFLAKSLKAVVINADDAYGIRLLNDPAISASKIAYSAKGNHKESGISADHWVVADAVELNSHGIRAQLVTPWGRGPLLSKLLGAFNVANLLAVAGVLGALFGDINKWIVGLNNAKAVAGRMQHFVSDTKANVVVDYAHTPDALEKVLQSLRQHCQRDADSKLWCLFGCGGDRDNSKRALMGAAAERFADVCVITDDNPRTEDAAAIAKMIQAGMNRQHPYIADRKTAIRYALEEASDADLIVVAGKGHEDYQIIGTEKRHYSDLETVSELLAEVAA